MFRREVKVVAAVREDCREYRVSTHRVPEDDFVESTELLPKSLKIVVYGEDPGFFLEADEDEARAGSINARF